jgi:hypothetical protein
MVCARRSFPLLALALAGAAPAARAAAAGQFEIVGNTLVSAMMVRLFVA